MRSIYRASAAAVLGAASIAFAFVSTQAPALAVGNHGASSAGCIAHRFQDVPEPNDIYYTPGCSGHDEPELDPISSVPGSARDLTWTFVLPKDGASPVSATGPTFWFGGTVRDPDSLYGQAFVELQFYPDSKVTKCASNGGFNLTYSKNNYGACSPVWQVHNNTENAAFNAMLVDSKTGEAMTMHAGDTISVHFFTTPAKDGFHEGVKDLTTGRSGLIVLNSAKHGPLMPYYGKQEIGKALKWGWTYGTPMSFVWEIGHTSPYSKPADQFCLPGNPICDSYNGPSWAATSPILIKSVAFGDGSSPTAWGVVSDYGGTDEVNQFCPTYGGPYCIYPWYTATKSGSLSYGVDYADTAKDFGKALQFQPALDCGGPYGPNSTYCDTIIHP
jgi:hypothetical protein